MYLECQEQYSSFKWQNVVMHKFNNGSFSKVKRILWDEWLFKHETVNNYPFHTLSREDWDSLNSRIYQYFSKLPGYTQQHFITSS